MLWATLNFLSVDQKALIHVLYSFMRDTHIAYSEKIKAFSLSVLAILTTQLPVAGSFLFLKNKMKFKIEVTVCF